MKVSQLNEHNDVAIPLLGKLLYLLTALQLYFLEKKRADLECPAWNGKYHLQIHVSSDNILSNFDESINSIWFNSTE